MRVDAFGHLSPRDALLQTADLKLSASVTLDVGECRFRVCRPIGKIAGEGSSASRRRLVNAPWQT